MAKITNNEKIIYALDKHRELAPHLYKYLDILQQRYDWLSKQRADYTELVMNLGDLRGEIKNMLRIVKKNKDYYSEGLKEVSLLSREYEELGLVSDELQELETMLKENKYNEKIIDDVRGMLETNSKLHKILSHLTEDKMVLVAEEDLETFIEYIEFYTKGLRHYKELDKEEIMSDLKTLSDWCESNEIDNSGLEYMINIIEITEEYPDKEGAEELLDMLSDARDPEAYISRGYTVLDHYRPLIDSMNHLRRVVRESREFRSVDNAVKRYEKCIEELDSYYKRAYLQAGGMPENTKANISRYAHLRRDSDNEE